MQKFGNANSSNSEFYKWINYNFSIVMIMKELGHIDSSYEVDSDISVFCPFHENTNTPAARLYIGDNSIYCFGECKRTYRPIDFFILKNGDSYDSLWRRFGDEFMDYRNKYIKNGLGILERVNKFREFEKRDYFAYFKETDTSKIINEFSNGKLSFKDISYIFDRAFFNDIIQG